jgi:lactoylglutathione lyase
MIKGLFETHIHVSNLENSMKFYGEILGLPLARYIEPNRSAFYWIGQPGEAMFGIWEKPDTEITPQHFAFRCEINDVLNKSVEYLKQRNIPSYNFLKDGNSTPMVFAWMPALAIYFRDPDNHELEFIAMLSGKPRPELGILNYEEYQEKILNLKKNSG